MNLVVERTFGAAPVAARFIASVSCRLRRAQLFQSLSGFLFYRAVYRFFCIFDDQFELSVVDRGSKHPFENFVLERYHGVLLRPVTNALEVIECRRGLPHPLNDIAGTFLCCVAGGLPLLEGLVLEDLVLDLDDLCCFRFICRLWTAGHRQ